VIIPGEEDLRWEQRFQTWTKEGSWTYQYKKTERKGSKTNEEAMDARVDWGHKSNKVGNHWEGKICWLLKQRD